MQPQHFSLTSFEEMDQHNIVFYKTDKKFNRPSGDLHGEDQVALVNVLVVNKKTGKETMLTEKPTSGGMGWNATTLSHANAQIIRMKQGLQSVLELPWGGKGRGATDQLQFVEVEPGYLAADNGDTRYCIKATLEQFHNNVVMALSTVKKPHYLDGVKKA